MDKMTPREALTKLINILENSSAYVNEDGFPMGTLRKTYDTDEAEKVLEALVIATEQAPTLEKLGYRLFYKCDKKNDTDYGLIIYENEKAYIIYERGCGWYKVASRTYKQEDEKQLAFDDEEILALAEVIKEMENTK